MSHIDLDPLRRDQLAVLPLHRFRAAIVLADEGWRSSDAVEERQHDEQNAVDVIDQPSVLRQDALMVMVQVRPSMQRCQCNAMQCICLESYILLLTALLQLSTSCVVQ